MARPLLNEYPINRSTCTICGAAFGFDVDDDMIGAEVAAEYRKFLGEHALCQVIGMAATACQFPNCRSTAVGPAQRCVAHGGGRKGVVDRRLEQC